MLIESGQSIEYCAFSSVGIAKQRDDQVLCMTCLLHLTLTVPADAFICQTQSDHLNVLAIVLSQGDDGSAK